MSKKMLKGMSILLIAVFMLAMVMTPVMATTDLLDPNSIVPNDDAHVAATTKTIASQIIGIVQVVAISVALIVLIFVAIKYMSAAPNDKAEIKKHLVVYVVGAVILFATSGILELIESFAGILK